jgi:glucosamine-6-phosphate deaminase
MRIIKIGKPACEVPACVYPDGEALGCALAGDILERIDQARRDGRRFLLGCPGGRSLRSTYLALGRANRQQHGDLSHVVIVMMDDYLVPGDGGLAHCDAQAHYSCRRFAWREIQAVLNEGLPTSRQIPADHVWFPDPADPPAYDGRLRDAGGIDLFLIASGASDGHVAFNPPGSEPASQTRIVELPESTRRDNLATFPEFKALADVPLHGLTVGLGTIADLSASVWLVMHGQGKRHALTCLRRRGEFSPDWPVSVIFRCRNARIALDEAIVGGLLDK